MRANAFRRVTLQVAAGLLATLAFPLASAAPSRRTQTVPPCAHVSLSASYLALVKEPNTAASGPGFDFILRNDTDQTVKLAEPVPASVHWYAHVGGRWLWRASSGGGGSLVDATREKGGLVAYPAAQAASAYLEVAPHQQHEWVVSVQMNPSFVYRPGCARCLNPGENEYRAVFAYAYLPARGEAGLLSCGLRSSPVVMPPHPE